MSSIPGSGAFPAVPCAGEQFPLLHCVSCSQTRSAYGAIQGNPRPGDVPALTCGDPAARPDTWTATGMSLAVAPSVLHHLSLGQAQTAVTELCWIWPWFVFPL